MSDRVLFLLYNQDVLKVDSYACIYFTPSEFKMDLHSDRYLSVNDLLVSKIMLFKWSELILETML